jgi:hypothetical protein
VAKEPGLYPTTDLELTISVATARPGDPLVLEIHGAGARSLTRGKIIAIQAERDGTWESAGAVIVQTAPGPGIWKPPGGRFVTTMEGYSGTTPMHFEVPPIPPGSYRIRIDATTGDADAEEDLHHRTATLYAQLRVLPEVEN